MIPVPLIARLLCRNARRLSWVPAPDGGYLAPFGRQGASGRR